MSQRHHMSRDCRSTTRCSCCNGQHHTSICKDSHVNRSSGNANQPSSRLQNNTATTQSLTSSVQPPYSSQSAHKSTATGPLYSTTTTGLYYVNTDKLVLLQTSQVYIHNPDNPTRGITINLILNGGSQRSYITKRVKDVLRLEADRAEEGHNQTFRSDNTRTQTIKVDKVLKEGSTTNDSSLVGQEQ